MSRLPRILPLLAVAAGGVLALRAVAGLEGAPEFLKGAVAWAETPAAPTKGAPPAASTPAATAAATSVAAAASVIATRPAAAVCAPSAAELAREAGISPAELRVLQSLGTRRGELDAREEAFSTQVALLNTAESKLDAKMKALAALKLELTGMVSQANTQRDAEIVRLVKVYESMKPKDAAAVMATLDDRVLLPVAARMKERALAAVLSQMPRPQAKALTEKLADRFNAQNVAARVTAAVNAPATAAPAAPGTPPATTPSTTPAGAAPSTSPAAAPAAPPRRPARPRPRPRPAARPAATTPAPAVAAPAATPPAASVTAPPASPPRPARPAPRGDGPT